MNYAAEKALIEGFIAEHWTFTPVKYDNVQVDNELNEWIRATIVSGPARQITLGDNPEFRVNSNLVVQIFTRPNSGSGRAMELADAANEMFRNLDLDGLRFLVPQVMAIPNSAEWFQVNVSTEFYRRA